MCTYALSLVEWEGKGLRGRMGREGSLGGVRCELWVGVECKVEGRGRRGVVRSGTVGFEAKVMCGGHECVLASTSL
jgi:hypothetical protein